MKKLFIIITFVSLFLSINAYSLDTKIDIKKLDEIKEMPSGNSMKEGWGLAYNKELK